MKDFDAWNEVKKINSIGHRLYFKEREIWWISLGLNIGYEEDGKGEVFMRPVLVMKKFNTNIFLGCPLSKIIKPLNKYYRTINLPAGERSVIISQIRLHDAKRFKERIIACSVEDFEKIKKALRDLF